MEKIRVGYIGAGRQSSSSIYPSLRYAPIELVASCALTRDQKDAQRVAREYGAREQRYYLGYEKIVGSRTQKFGCLHGGRAAARLSSHHQRCVEL